MHNMLARFIELPKDLRPALEAAYEDLAPASQVLIEAEFIDKTGSLFRMDRVLVDKDAVTVIDFKTGGENTKKYSF